MRRSLIFLTLLAVILLNGCAKPPADLILTGGEIYTMESDQPWAESVVITGNKIAAVLAKGENIESYKGPNTRVVDLAGRFVVPGFIDGHVEHFDPQDTLQMKVSLTPDGSVPYPDGVGPGIYFVPDGK